MKKARNPDRILSDIKLVLRIKKEKNQDFYVDLGLFQEYVDSEILKYFNQASKRFSQESKKSHEKIMNYIVENCADQRIKKDIRKFYSENQQQLKPFSAEESFFLMFSNYANMLGDLLLDDFSKENREISRCKAQENMIHYMLLDKLFGKNNLEFSKFAKNKAKGLENELLQGTRFELA